MKYQQKVKVVLSISNQLSVNFMTLLFVSIMLLTVFPRVLVVIVLVVMVVVVSMYKLKPIIKKKCLKWHKESRPQSQT